MFFYNRFFLCSLRSLRSLNLPFFSIYHLSTHPISPPPFSLTMFFDSSVYIASGLLSTRALTGKRSAGNAPAPSKKSRKGKGSASAQADSKQPIHRRSWTLLTRPSTEENVSVQSTRFTLTAFVKRGKSGAAAAKGSSLQPSLRSELLLRDFPRAQAFPRAQLGRH